MDRRASPLVERGPLEARRADFPLRCWAEIDLAAIEKNLRKIRSKLPPKVRTISVIKADGYGLGATRVMDALLAGGAKMLAVANLAEAAEIRQRERDIPILLLSATLPEEDDSLFEYNLTPTVSCVDEVRRYSAAAERHGKRLPVHLKFDTGMGRLGIWHDPADELLDAVARSPGLQVGGLYSHFASAGEDAAFTRLQRERFLSIVHKFQPTGELLIHIDNSSGLASFPADGPFNTVRIGLLQLGILPAPDSPLEAFGVAATLSLHTRVSVVKKLPRGAPISYGRTHTLERDSTVAVLAAGYADGIRRACSNRASVLVHGQRCPILGNVTMDEIVIDVTDLSGVVCGDRATIIGRQGDDEISLHEYSAWFGTIPWESLCALGKRVARVYV